MTTPQADIFVEGSRHFYHLEYQLDSSVSETVLRAALANALIRNPNIQQVVAFGKQAWDRLQPAWAPADLVGFETINGVDGHTAPSTQSDLFFWIHAQDKDDVFDQVLTIQNALAEVTTVTLDLAGFRYHDDRDLIGFVDGSANPKEDARMLAALIPEGQLGAGGSYVLGQQWIHNLAAFNRLPVEQQEKVVGRTKQDSIELEGDEMPDDSHVSRTDVKVDGTAMKIYRRSAPYGNATEHGLYFLAFGCEVRRFQVQLERMYGVTDDGLHDQIIHYSAAKTGSYWFAPSQTDLEALLQA